MKLNQWALMQPWLTDFKIGESLMNINEINFAPLYAYHQKHLALAVVFRLWENI